MQTLVRAIVDYDKTCIRISDDDKNVWDVV